MRSGVPHAHPRQGAMGVVEHAVAHAAQSLGILQKHAIAQRVIAKFALQTMPEAMIGL